MDLHLTETSSRSWNINFFSFWAGQAFSLLGSRLVQFALIWWLTQKTGSATMRAMASLMGLLPDVILMPIAGALIDRWNRKAVMIVADLSVAAATVVLIYLFWTGMVQVWHIYAVMFFRSATGAFQFPAVTASTSLMVPEKHLTRISGLNQALQGALSIVAPPLGAMLIGVLPMHQVLMIDVVTAGLAVSILAFIRVPQPAQKVVEGNQAAGKAGVWADLKAGFAYVRAWPGLMVIIGVGAFIGLVVNPAFSLIPLLITQHFHGDAMQYGVFESAAGVGLIVGGLTLSAWGGFTKRITTTMAGMIGMGIGSIMMGWAPSNAFWLAIAGSAVTGFLQPMVNGPMMSIIQAKVAPEMQGRVITLFGGLFNLAAPLGLALAGPVSDLIGVGNWIAIGGILCSIIGVAAFFIPVVMQVEDYQPAGSSGLVPDAAKVAQSLE